MDRKPDGFTNINAKMLESLISNVFGDQMDIKAFFDVIVNFTLGLMTQSRSISNNVDEVQSAEFQSFMAQLNSMGLIIPAPHFGNDTEKRRLKAVLTSTIENKYSIPLLSIKLTQYELTEPESPQESIIKNNTMEIIQISLNAFRCMSVDFLPCSPNRNDRKQGVLELIDALLNYIITN